MPKGRGLMGCSCGFTTQAKQKITEIVKSTSKPVEVIEKEVETNPLTNEKCDKCGHGRAYYWFIQTRASDEPETRFLKCEKCSHVWREY